METLKVWVVGSSRERMLADAYRMGAEYFGSNDLVAEIGEAEQVPPYDLFASRYWRGTAYVWVRISRDAGGLAA